MCQQLMTSSLGPQLSVDQRCDGSNLHAGTNAQTVVGFTFGVLHNYDEAIFPMFIALPLILIFDDVDDDDDAGM